MKIALSSVTRFVPAIFAFVTGCASMHVPMLAVAPPTSADPFALYRQQQFMAAENAFAHPGCCSTVDAWLTRADCDRRLHVPAKEFDSLKQAVRQYPRSVPAWIALSKFETRSDRLDRADLALQRAIAVDPNNPDALCERGLLRLRQHRTDEAMACFTRASGGSTSADVASITP